MELGLEGAAAERLVLFQRERRTAVGSADAQMDGHQRPERCWAAIGPRGTGRAAEIPAQAFAAAWDAGAHYARRAAGLTWPYGLQSSTSKVLVYPLLRIVLRVCLSLV